MAKAKQVDDLQIDDDMDFQRKEWRVERIGWVAMALLALAGLLGLFGDGPLAKAKAVNGPLQVEYHRFERLLSPTQMVVQVDPEAVQNEEVRLVMGRNLMEALKVSAIAPQPERMELTPDSLVYIFKVSEASAPVRVTFDMETAKAGSHSGDIALENGASVNISQFIYP